MSKKGIIISGGTIEKAFATQVIEAIRPDVLIGVDRGLEFLYENQIAPTYIVGDFDSISPEVISYYKEQTDIPVREFNPVKDASDTEIAVRLSIQLGVEQFWILGGTGTRLDHVLANIQVLKIAKDAGVKAYVLDAYNKISLIEKEKHLRQECAFGTYFSVFPLGGIVESFSITGAKYPLNHHTLRPYDSLCVSNQIEGEEAVITFPNGIVILMETRDQNSAESVEYDTLL